MSPHVGIACLLVLQAIRASNGVITAKPQKNSATQFLELSETQDLTEAGKSQTELLDGIASAVIASPLKQFGISIGTSLLLVCCCTPIILLFACNSFLTKSRDESNYRSSLSELETKRDQAVKELPQNIHAHFDSPEFTNFCNDILNRYYNKLIHLAVRDEFGKTVSDDKDFVATVRQDMKFQSLADVNVVCTYCETKLYLKEKRMISLKSLSKPGKKIVLNMTTMSGEAMQLEIDSSTPVAQVRDQVAENMGLESGKQVKVCPMGDIGFDMPKDPNVSIGSIPTTEFTVAVLAEPQETY